MRSSADFIHLTLEQKNTFLVTKCWRETLNFVCKGKTNYGYIRNIPPRHTVYV